jgi:hypothetical protein
MIADSSLMRPWRKDWSELYKEMPRSATLRPQKWRLAPGDGFRRAGAWAGSFMEQLKFAAISDQILRYKQMTAPPIHVAPLGDRS